MSKLRNAAQEWLSQFDHVPASIIEKMAEADPMMSCYDSDSFRLLASPRIECGHCGTTYEGSLRLHDLEALARDERESCLFCEGNPGDQWVVGLPTHRFPCAWSTLFAPRNSLDREWVLEHADQVAGLGLFVFESEDYGCLLGVDGAGFDFYESFWIPLYQMRGLKWHE